MARKMKDSGIEWIGNIPISWEIPKVKYLFDIGRGRVIAKTELEDEGYPVYSSQTKNNGVLGYINTYDFDRSQLTWTTDGANAGTAEAVESKLKEIDGDVCIEDTLVTEFDFENIGINGELFLDGNVASFLKDIKL